MKALVTGAGGQLATELLAAPPRGWTVEALSEVELDIRDLAAVRAAVTTSAPDVVLNAAAYTAVDKAESDSELAYAVNRDGAANLALAATQAGALLEKYSGDQARLLVAVLAGSRIFGDTLAARPDWVADLEIERLRFSRRDQGLRSELAERLAPALRGGDFTAATVCLREFKSREWLRIDARDLARLGNAAQITGELSDVADVCLEGLYQICHARLVARHGRPWHQDSAGRWQSTGFSLIGVGRLGGRELSYRPEVDLLFLYTAEGQVFKSRPAPGKSPRATLSNHQFFTELAGVFSAESSQVTPQGILFRINSGLRPEGEAGPLCRSLEGYENYYSQWGQVWEGLMLIKARPVAGETGLAAEFLEMIQAFRYPRAIGPEVLSEMGSLKNRIETGPPPSGGRERNVYLGRGGLREIEFIAQTQQLLQGGAAALFAKPPNRGDSGKTRALPVALPRGHLGVARRLFFPEGRRASFAVGWRSGE